jgi:ADP-ribosylation factor-binding protein GGA
MTNPAAASSTPPLQQGPGPSAPKPNYDILSLNSSQPIPPTSTPSPAISQQPTATPPPADPFASLVSGSSRKASPLAAGQPPAPAPASSSLLDLAGSNPPPGKSTATTSKAAEDDEWDFTSSLPQSSALPTTNRVQVLDSSLRIEFVARRNASGGQQQIQVVALFTNTTNQPLNELHFQVAVEKVRERERERGRESIARTASRLTMGTGIHTATAAAVRAGDGGASAERGAAGDGGGGD